MPLPKTAPELEARLTTAIAGLRHLRLGVQAARVGRLIELDGRLAELESLAGRVIAEVTQ